MAKFLPCRMQLLLQCEIRQHESIPLLQRMEEMRNISSDTNVKINEQIAKQVEIK